MYVRLATGSVCIMSHPFPCHSLAIISYLFLFLFFFCGVLSLISVGIYSLIIIMHAVSFCLLRLVCSLVFSCKLTLTTLSHTLSVLRYTKADKGTKGVTMHIIQGFFFFPSYSAASRGHYRPPGCCFCFTRVTVLEFQVCVISLD